VQQTADHNIPAHEQPVCGIGNWQFNKPRAYQHVSNKSNAEVHCQRVRITKFCGSPDTATADAMNSRHCGPEQSGARRERV
jgi:hypothetical protein